jgi:hypothetical protein
MTETPPAKPPPPSLRERLKLSHRFVDVTDQHVGEVFVLSNPGSVDGSARGAWIKKDELRGVLPPAFFLPKKPDPRRAADRARLPSTYHPRHEARPLGSVASGRTTKSSQKGPPIALKRAISAD